MLIIFSFLIELQPTEKSYASPFKEIFLCSSFAICFLNKNYTNFCYRQPEICKFMFQLHIRNFHPHCNENFQAKFCICFTKVNTIFFTVASVLSFIPRVVPSPEFFDYQYEIMKYYQHQNYNISSRVIIQTPATLSIKCYFLTITRKFTFDCVSC